MKVLDSVRVLEIGGLGPGPFCAMHLADLGADVVSLVRRPEGRAITSTLLNRGKRSVFVDLKDPADRDTVLQLVAEADVLIEGMRPGVMERLGLGPDECLAANPRLVYGRMTGWGQDGPLAPRAGHDTNYAAVSGALWGCSPADARPVSPFAVLGDIGGGALYLMTGILSGIVQARATGRGTVVDAAIVDGAAHMLNLMLSARALAGAAGAHRCLLRRRAEPGRGRAAPAPARTRHLCRAGRHPAGRACAALRRRGLSHRPGMRAGGAYAAGARAAGCGRRCGGVACTPELKKTRRASTRLRTRVPLPQTRSAAVTPAKT